MLCKLDDSDADGDRDDRDVADKSSDELAAATAAAAALDGSDGCCNDDDNDADAEARCSFDDVDEDEDAGDDGATDATHKRLDRLALIFVRLYALRGIDADTIESLFFANLIGQVEIDNVVPYILKLGGAGVSSLWGRLCRNRFFFYY